MTSQVKLTRPERERVDNYWQMLHQLGKIEKLALATMLTNAVLQEEESAPRRKVRSVLRRAVAPSDAELEARFADKASPEVPETEFTSQDIIKANSGRIIQSVEKWL